MHEELGIQASPEQLKFAGNFRIHYEKEFNGSMFRDNEVVFVYVYDAPVKISDVTIQKDELDCVEWFDLEMVYEEVKVRHRERFCVPREGLEVLINYLNDNEFPTYPDSGCSLRAD